VKFASRPEENSSGQEAGRDGLALIDLAMEWKTQFIEKGWTA
jgi:hypothetical protein